MTLQKILQGVSDFQKNVFETQRRTFESLADGQEPKVLFITCSDSRIDLSMLTQTGPGDLFIIRNAGNIVPPIGSDNGGVGATIEYAVNVLNVEDIIVCGHSKCGAMSALISNKPLTNLPHVERWLSFAEATKAVVKGHEEHLEGEDLVNFCIEQNVLVQLEHLRTLPSVAAKLARKEIELHGWVYKFETGEVFAYDPAQQKMLPIKQRYAALVGNSR